MQCNAMQCDVERRKKNAMLSLSPRRKNAHHPQKKEASKEKENPRQ
jgi:hypothetical protein